MLPLAHLLVACFDPQALPLVVSGSLFSIGADCLGVLAVV